MKKMISLLTALYIIFSIILSSHLSVHNAFGESNVAIQVVTNPDFREGMLEWEVAVVKVSHDGPRAPYPRIEPVAGCEYSDDGYCIVFDTPWYSDGYIFQRLTLPNGSATINVKFRREWGEDRLVLYVVIIDLEKQKVREFLPRSSPWSSSISEFGGSQIELRVGVRGRQCLFDCYTYLDYVKIIVIPNMELTTYTTSLTSTVTVSSIVTETIYVTFTSFETQNTTITSFEFYPVTITETVTTTVNATATETATTVIFTTLTITLSRIVREFADGFINVLIRFFLPFAFSLATAIIILIYSSPDWPKAIRFALATIGFFIILPIGVIISEYVLEPSEITRELARFMGGYLSATTLILLLLVIAIIYLFIIMAIIRSAIRKK